MNLSLGAGKWIPCLALLIFASISFATPARGEGPAKDKAIAAFKQGVEHYKAGRYGDALVAFTEANRLQPSWKLLFNIGQCEASLKRYGKALDVFEEYLIAGGDEVPEDRRDYVSDEIRRLQPLVGIVEVEAPRGLEVRVDGEGRGAAPLDGPIRLAAGSHQVELFDGAVLVREERVKVMGGVTSRVDLVGAPSAPATEESIETESVEQQAEEPVPMEEHGGAAAEPGPSRLRTAGWVVLGLGAVVAVAGGVTGGIALSTGSDLEQKCEGGTCPPSQHGEMDRMNNLALSADVLIGVGAAAAVAGIVMVVVGDKDDENQVSVGALGPAGIAVGWRY